MSDLYFDLITHDGIVTSKGTLSGKTDINCFRALVTDNDFSLREDVLLPEWIRQLLRHVIVAEGILEGQIEKVVGLNYVAETVSVSLAAKFAAIAINIDAYVLRQLLHVLHPATFGIAIAYKPSYWLALTPDGVQYRRWHFIYRVPHTCEKWLVLAYSRQLIRWEDARVFVVGTFADVGIICFVTGKLIRFRIKCTIMKEIR